MSDSSDSAEKSFEASSRKLSELRKKGEIVRSTDLLIGLSYLGLCASLYLFGSQIFQYAWSILYGSWDQMCAGVSISCKPKLDSLISQGPSASALVFVSFIALSFCFVALGLIATKGIVFTPKNLAFKMSRVSVLQNAKNKFGAKGLFEFFKSFCKLLIYSTFCYFFVVGNIDAILGLVYYDDRTSLSVGFALILKLIVLLTVVAILFGALDYFWQYSHFLKKNRMSQKEMRDEHKESEGDPHFKHQRMSRAREIALSHMLKDVADTDVVIVNPTHYAVALKWSRQAGSAPVCLAKGVDHVALKIREAAKEAGVPIFEDPPTARALYANLDLNEEIDPEFYVPVAAAIRYASEIKEKVRNRGY